MSKNPQQGASAPEASNSSAENLENAKAAAQAARASSPRKVMKGSRSVEHDLFKLQPAKMLKNQSWKFKDPMIVELEHAHIFHSINDATMQPNSHCTAVGGHTHEIKVDWTKKVRREKRLPDGRVEIYEGPAVTCGPAVEVKSVQRGNRSFRQFVPVGWPGYDQQTGQEILITDTHTHEVEYLDTETISLGQRNERRQEERQRVAAVMQGPPATQAARQAGMQQNAQSVAGNVKEGAGE